MATYCKPPRGQGMGRGKVTPQVTLSFPAGGPPTLDTSAPAPDPTPAKPQVNKNFWPGQVWNHLTNMFTSDPPVCWVNPQLVECHVPVAQCPPQYVAPNPGGTLWHAAPQGNTQMYTDPLSMLGDTNTYFPGEVNPGCFYPASEKGTNISHPTGGMQKHACFPPGKMENMNANFPTTKPDPSCFYRPSKTEKNAYIPTGKAEKLNCFLTGRMKDTNVNFPATKRDSGCFYPAPERVKNTYIPAGKADQFTCYPTRKMEYTNSYFYPASKIEKNTCFMPTPKIISFPTGEAGDRGHPTGQPYPNGYFPCFVPVPKGRDSFPAATTKSNNFPTATTDKNSHFPTATHSDISQIKPNMQSTSVSSKPLNPYAQEWVPPGYITIPGTIPSTAMPLVQENWEDKLKASKEGRVSPQPVMEAVRSDPSTELNPDCLKATPDQTDLNQSSIQSSLSSVSKPSADCLSATPDQTEPFTSSNLSPENSQQMSEQSLDCTRATSDLVESNLKSQTPQCQPETLNSTMDIGSTSKCQPTKSATETNGHLEVPNTKEEPSNATVSYARVLERATPSPPPPPVSPPETKYKGVDQPIPKIFQRDRTPPREPIIGKMAVQQTPDLFRRPNRNQKMRSRMFLRELKELKDDNNGGVWCGSPSSISSTSSCELPPSPKAAPSTRIPPSPTHSILSTSSSSTHSLPSPSTSPIPESPTHASPMPRSAPKAIPMSRDAKCSETPSTVSESESSISDIDFVDEVDCVSSIPSVKAGTRKPINKFLACILGSGDSDDEEEEEEDWDDWDVRIEDKTELDLDDSWETFGLGMVLVCRAEPKESQSQPVVPEKVCQSGPPKEGPGKECQKEEFVAQCQSEPEVDNDTYLAEVNKRWESAVGSPVEQKSQPRVSFGSVTVHPMVAWAHAYRQARRGPWEQEARDRARFRKKIEDVETVLAPVLHPTHRRAVYERLHPTTLTATVATPTTTPATPTTTLATPS